MAPRDFTEDGAAGAGMQAGDSYPSAISMSDPGPAPPQPTAQASAGPSAAPSYSGGGGGFAPPAPPKQATRKTPNDYPVGSPQWQSQFIQDTTGITHPEFLQNTGGMQMISAGFSEGGAISEADNDYDGNGSPAQEAVQRALSTIDGVLAFGRRLHGLGGGGDNEGAIPGAGKQAGAMPMIPGNQSQTPGPYKPTQPRPQQQAANYPMPVRPGGQSETGIPPAQPGPGTLPPTSNPFGKRADNDQDGDSDAPGAIDTDEETA